MTNDKIQAEKPTTKSGQKVIFIMKRVTPEWKNMLQSSLSL